MQKHFKGCCCWREEVKYQGMKVTAGAAAAASLTCLERCSMVLRPHLSITRLSLPYSSLSLPRSLLSSLVLFEWLLTAFLRCLAGRTSHRQEGRTYCKARWSIKKAGGESISSALGEGNGWWLVALLDLVVCVNGVVGPLVAERPAELCNLRIMPLLPLGDIFLVVLLPDLCLCKQSNADT